MCNIPGNVQGLQVQKVAAVDVVKEGYGRVSRSERSISVSPYQKKKSDTQALADQVTREFVGSGGKKEDAMGAMFKIARNHRTEPQGDIEEVLQIRGKLYDEGLDPKWFSYDSDLGEKAKSTQDRNKARALLAATELILVKIARREVWLSKEGVEMCSARSIKEVSHYLYVAGDAAQDDGFIVII